MCISRVCVIGAIILLLVSSMASAGKTVLTVADWWNPQGADPTTSDMARWWDFVKEDFENAIPMSRSSTCGIWVRRTPGRN